MAAKDGHTIIPAPSNQEQAATPANNGDTAKLGKPQSGSRPPYSAFSPGRRRLILGIVTAAGFFGPLAGGIYLPALPTLQRTFNTSVTVINATVSVFMGVLAIAVSIKLEFGFTLGIVNAQLCSVGPEVCLP